MDEKPVLPLEYASARSRPGLTPARAELIRRRLIGATRQIILAVGLTCVTGGLGRALSHDSPDEGPFWMGLGGALIGISVPLRDGDRIRSGSPPAVSVLPMQDGAGQPVQPILVGDPGDPVAPEIRKLICILGLVCALYGTGRCLAPASGVPQVLSFGGLLIGIALPFRRPGT